MNSPAKRPVSQVDVAFASSVWLIEEKQTMSAHHDMPLPLTRWSWLHA